jgi:hypothetical protein
MVSAERAVGTLVLEEGITGAWGRTSASWKCSSEL